MVALWLTAAWCAEPVTWDQLTDEVLSAWEAGPGEGREARVQAAEQAARRVPVGPESVRAEVQWGVPEQQQVLAAVAVPLALGVRERRFGAAQAQLVVADGEVERWSWVLGVQDAWLRWWTAAEVAEHLDAYAQDVEQGLAGFEAAVDEGLMAPLSLEDLRAESLQVRAEAAAVEQEAAMLEAQLRAYFGDRPLDPGEHHLHDVDEVVDNPWTSLEERAADHPLVRRAEAEALAEKRRASALLSARSPSVEAGPMWAPDNAGNQVPFLFAGIEVPLQPGVSADRRRARGAQAAAEADARWQARRVEAQLQAEAAAFTATQHRLRRLHDEVLEPLSTRQERLEAAFAENLVTADRLVRARREHHEAEHELVRVAGDLLASVARARAMERLLEEGR